MKNVTTARCRLATLALAAVMAAGVAAWAQAIREVPRITVDELKALMAENQVLVVDVRVEGEYLVGHIPGAIHIAYVDADWRAAELKGETRQIVTYCA